VIEPGVGGIGNGLLLHRGIDVDPLQCCSVSLSCAGGLQRLVEQMSNRGPMVCASYQGSSVASGE
jgi:hypothetical protein